jgi:hypothetical protein
MIGDREAGIAEAYGNTFSWALEEEGFDRLVRMPFTEHGESSKSKVDSSFVSWLVSDSDHLFWLSGKAASGKSTLMKYLFNDKRTKKKLMKWAGASDPILAAFFFFERGDALQKSREGLLRSLLWQILSQRRDLISLVFDPIREDQNQPVPLPQITWPILKKAFTQLLDSIPKSTKICLFVDGLDEYRMMDREKDYGENEMHLLSYGTNDDFRDYPEGNWIRDGHQEIASLFQNTKAQNVKICVASRELTPFEAAFATTPRLRIHEFTKGDIHNYVYSRLMGEGREHFYDADDMKDIADTVVKYAEGVFLWVRLVVEELRKGQDDGDRIEDLYTKLMKLPKTLGGRNGLYMRMVDMSPARGEAIKLFQLTLYHGFPPDLDVLFFAADELYEADNSKKSIFLDPEPLAPSDEIHNDRFLRAVKQEVKFVTADRAQQKLNQLERRLKSRCMGLLEVPRSSRKVQFFHQTCKEFVYGLLQKTQTEEKLEDSQLVLRFLSAYVMKLKTHDFMGGRSTLELGPFEAAFGALARFARCIEPSHRPDISDGCFQLMDEVRQLCDTRDMSQDENIINYCFKTYMQKKRSSVRFFPWDFLSLSTINLLETYIQMTLERTGIDPDNGTKLLCEIIMEPHMGIEPTILKIINHLLSHGVDLHRRVGNSAFAMSAWETLLHRAVHLKKTGRDLGAIVAIMTTISNFKANINGQDQVRFLTHAGLEFSGIPWEGNLRQVLCGLLKLPESVVLALIGIPTVDWGDYLPELPGMGSWKVEVKRYQPTTT